MKTKALIFATALLLTIAPKAFAQSCGQYGGYTGCVPGDITINKQVQKANESSVFVENIVSGDPAYSPGSQVLYKLMVTNTGGQTFSQVTVHDILPTFLTFVSGPGSFDSATRTLTYTLDNLQAGETRTDQVLTKVVDAGQFPKNQTMLCDIENTAQAQTDNKFAEDKARICIQTSVLGVSTLPVTGFNDLALLLPFAGFGLTGIALLKKRG